MCLLFMYTNDDAGPGEYRMVLASNRDEIWTRPTQRAEFWSLEGQDIIAGEMIAFQWLCVLISNEFNIVLFRFIST